MTEIYTFQTEKQKKDASKLFDSLELISFPFLSTLKGKIEKDGSIHVENQIMSQNCIEQFILKEKDLNKVIDEQKLFDFAAQGALALSFLHKQKIAHGKISLKSVCIGEDNTLQIGPVDFFSNFQEGDIKEGYFDRFG
ncbi:MAG: hypothetical protein EZS28_041918 [Streblomastix strix]|uniref:Protein kinase domain-containing protein n=1 Tax=Streblomastix strix TaxID=222440 RepID=A0A5J4TVQ5_9EUKA|nr:MAG: hypothetical protein EZS28_041918 [Streblomastix strix]